MEEKTISKRTAKQLQNGSIASSWRKHIPPSPQKKSTL